MSSGDLNIVLKTVTDTIINSAKASIPVKIVTKKFVQMNLNG